MRVLITGASGFIGRHLVPLLGDHEVLSLAHPGDRSPTPAGVRTMAGDLARPDSWRDEVVRFAPEWCLHLAWEGLPDYSLGKCRVNLDATLSLLEVLVASKVQRVVVPGSCWEYGRVTGAVAEDAVPVDCGVFAGTKHAIRMVLDAAAREAGFSYGWGRVFFAYGPGQRPTSLIPQLHAAYAEGRQPEIREPRAVQDFIYVEDVARGLLALAENERESGVFNIGTGHPTSVREIDGMVAEHFGKQRAAPSGTPQGFWADQRRTSSTCGWRATTDLRAGLAKTFAALQSGS